MAPGRGGLCVEYTSALLASVLFLLVLSHGNTQELVRGTGPWKPSHGGPGSRLQCQGTGETGLSPYALVALGSVRSG